MYYYYVQWDVSQNPYFSPPLWLKKFSPESEEEDSVNNLCSTAHFALALKILVGQYNKRYHQKFAMRIGLAYGGPVIAGVIFSIMKSLIINENIRINLFRKF